MSLISIPSNPLSETEEDIIKETLSSPVVKRYFKHLAYGIICNLCTGFPESSMSDAAYMRDEAVLKGQLALIETLLSIQPIPTKE